MESSQLNLHDRFPTDAGNAMNPPMMLRRRLEQTTATQSPTDSATQQTTSSNNKSSSSSYSNRSSSYSNRSSSRNQEPLLTTGEKIGAFIGGTVTLMIGLYFLLLNVKVKRRRKNRNRSHQDHPEHDHHHNGSPRRSTPGWKRHSDKHRKQQQRRRRPEGVAEKEDDSEDATLTSLGANEIQSQCDDGDSTMAIMAPSPVTRTPKQKPQPKKQQQRYRMMEDDHGDDDDSTKASTIEMTDASHYSLSSDDGTPSPRRSKSNAKSKAKSKAKRRSRHRGDDNTMFSDRTYTLTSVILNAILPAPNEHDDEANHYRRHEEEDDVEHNHKPHGGDDDSHSTLSSPFHPNLAPPTPPRLKRKHKHRTYFVTPNNASDDPTASGSVRTMGATTATGDVFRGIREEDRPFDCETATLPSLGMTDDHPFDCRASF